MLTLVSLASSREALKYLSLLDTISHLASIWSREIEGDNRWQAAIERECSVHLITALHRSLLQLSDAETREYLTTNEFHILLDQLGGAVWRDRLFLIKTIDVPLRDVAAMCLSLRETTVKLLEDASLLGFDQFRLVVFFFDWILEQVYSLWGNEYNSHGTALPVQSFDIEVLRSIAESVRSPVDLNPVLQAIVKRVQESGLWPMCAIGIIDPDDQEIRVPAQSGFSESYPANIKFPAGGSATLAAIHRKRPVAINDVYADHEFPVLPDAARAAGYRSILMVPLFIAEMRAVVAFCSKEAHEHTEGEIALANAIAQQVMIAIENAHEHQREKQRVDELQSLNHLIADQYRMLQRAVTTHTTLTRLVLDEAGLEGILEAVRKILGNPVAIEDEYFHLLTFSEDWEYFDSHRRDSIAAGGTTPAMFDHPEAAHMIADLHNHKRAMIVPILPAIGIEKRRIVAPIIAGAEILGYVWVMEAVRSFSEQQDLITTEQAALILALEMMKQRASYETELRLKADFLSDLFSESAAKESDLLQRASFLGFNFNKPATLLVVDISQGIWDGFDVLKMQQHNRQIILKVQEAVTRLTKENLVANQSGRIVVIAPSRINGSDLAQSAALLAEVIRTEIKHLHAVVNVLIGIGEVFQDIYGVRQASRQANRALDAAKSLGRVDEVIRLSDLGIYSILFREGDSSELLNFAKNSLVPLIDYDSQNGTELLKTLDAYLSRQTRLAETARHLYIHVNTLRQRLERIEHVLDISLEDAFAILSLQLALRVFEVSRDNHRQE